MVVRAAKIEDMQAMYELICEYKKQPPSKEIFEKIYEKTIKENRRHVVIATQGETAIGFSDTEVKLSLASCSFTAIVHDFFVLDNHRSKGVGTAMIFDICRKMRTLGCTDMHALASRVDVRSQNFLERHSFIKDKHLFTFKFDNNQ